MQTSLDGRADKEYYYRDGSLKWGSPIDVGHLILQLQTLDPKMQVGAVTFIELQGKRVPRTFGLSMSRERWSGTGFLNYKLPGPTCLALWVNPREPVAGLTPRYRVWLWQVWRKYKSRLRLNPHLQKSGGGV